MNALGHCQNRSDFIDLGVTPCLGCSVFPELCPAGLVVMVIQTTYSDGKICHRQWIKTSDGRLAQVFLGQENVVSDKLLAAGVAELRYC